MMIFFGAFFTLFLVCMGIASFLVESRNFAELVQSTF
jgi:hypothetical protein